MKLSVLIQAVVAGFLMACLQPSRAEQADPEMQDLVLSMWTAARHLHNYDVRITLNHIVQADGVQRVEFQRSFRVRKRGDSVLSTQPGLEVLASPAGALIIDRRKQRILLSRHPVGGGRAALPDGDVLAHSLKHLENSAASLRYVRTPDQHLVLEANSPGGEIQRTLIHVDPKSKLVSKIIYFHRSEDSGQWSSEIFYQWNSLSAEDERELHRGFYIEDKSGVTVPTERFANYGVVLLE